MGLACDARAAVTEGLTARTHACRSGTDSYNPDCYYIRERVRQRRVANSGGRPFVKEEIKPTGQALHCVGARLVALWRRARHAWARCNPSNVLRRVCGSCGRVA